MSSTLKKISCRRCRFRKLKCSRTEPCTNCAQASHACEYRDADTKRRPVSREYVSSLESRVAWLEGLLLRVKKAHPAERDSILEEVDFNDHLEPSKPPQPIANFDLNVVDARHSSRYFQAEIEEEALVYHGPTSIYHIRTNHAACNNTSPKPGASTADIARDSHLSDVAQHFGIDMQGEVVTNALMQFFKWHYPHFMFVYREAFLRDHFSSHDQAPYDSRKYWSGPLLFAICALGLVGSSDVESRDQSERFFTAAESMLLVSGLSQPSITKVQAFLCLAYYEIGRGNLSKGWGFSGIAFRMAQDLGFQQDPRYWISTDTSIVTLEDEEIRRRVYWGCYISDKLISLFLGRSVSLYDDDAEVEPTERLPDFPEMAIWLPIGYQNDDENSSNSTQPLIPSFKSQIELARVIQRILDALYSAQHGDQGSTRRKAVVDSINVDLCRWEDSLDASMKWNKWRPASERLLPTVAALHILFHSLPIVLYLDMATNAASEDGLHMVCLASAQAIVALLRKYRSQYSLQHAPLVFVYGTVRAAETVASFGIPEELSYLLQALDECSLAWSLARNTKERLEIALKDDS